MKYYLLSLILLSFALQAEIYRSVDKQGNVTFSDIPDTQAQRIELEALPTYKAPLIPATSENNVEPQVDDVDDVIEQPTYQITIVSPEQNQSIWEGGGIFTVSASIRPELNADRADQVQFKLDGAAVGEPQTSLSYTFEGVERGSHILTVSVVDKKGKILKTSKSVLVHIHRNSVINSQ